MGLQFQGRQGTGQAVLDTDLRDLHLAAGPGGGYLCAGTGGNGGLSVFALGPGGSMDLAGTAWFSALPGGIAETRLDLLTLNDTPLLLAGNGAGGLVYYTFDGATGIGAQDSVALPGIEAWTAAEAGDGTPLVFATDASGVPAAYAFSGSGLVQIAAAPGPGLDGEVLLAAHETGGDPLLIAASGAPGVITSYRLSQASGTLEPAGQVGAAEGLGLSAVTAIETVNAYGSAWVILGAAGSGTLSVLELGADGALTAADHLLDTAETRFGGVQALTVAELGGQVHVFAGGADDGITVFTLLPDGRLVHRQSLPDAAGLGLSDITALQAAAEGGAIRLFAASEGQPGLAEFTWAPAPGVVTDQEGGALSGTAGDDLLFARGGLAATLSGGAGDDILVAAAGTLTGGAGADVFVLRPGGQAVTVTDFELGADQLDLSHLPMLRNPGQLQVTALADGLELVFGDTLMVIRSASGDPFGTADLWPSLRFDTPDRLLGYAPPAASGPVEGSAGADLLAGTAGDDEILPGNGADTVSGLDGADTIRAGQGGDSVEGGAGGDHIYAGRGRDWVEGGDGDDRIWGRDGADTLFGGAGNDTLRGEKSADELDGGAGGDLLLGGDGADFVDGRDGDDDLRGGPGADTLKGGAGADTLKGGGGADAVKGGDGADTVFGQGGDDTLRGEGGDDLLDGGGGADLFVFSSGHGADRIADFLPGTDLIRIAGSGRSFAELDITAVPEGTAIDSGLGTILLMGLAPGQISEADFLLT